MKKLLVIVLLCCGLLTAQTVETYKGYTAAQLSAMQDYVTYPNTVYWNAHAYKYISLLLDRITDISGDSSGVLYSTMYDTLRDAFYNSVGDPVAAWVIGAAGQTSYWTDYTTELSSNAVVDMRGHTIDWTMHLYTDSCAAHLFNSQLDSNVTVLGGNYYGHADDNYFTGSFGTALTDSTFSVTGLTVDADELKHWHIIMTSGGANGHARQLKGNAATSGGSTTLYLRLAYGSYASSYGNGKWTVTPSAGNTFSVTPMEQWQYAFSLVGGNKIHISDANIYSFAGDGVEIINTNNVWLDKLHIDNSAGATYSGANYSGYYGDEYLIGRQAITVSADDNITTCPDGTTGVASTGLVQGLYITNSYLRGRYVTIDFEPNNAHNEIKDVVIDNCVIDGAGVGISFGSYVKMTNVLISNCTFRNQTGTASIVFWACDSTMSNVVIDNCTFDNISGTTEGAIYASAHDPGASGAVGFCTDVTIRNCKFINCTDYPIEFLGANKISVLNNQFIGCDKAVNLYAPSFTFRSNRGTVVSGNTFINCGTAGGLDAPLYISQLKAGSVTNNTFINTINTGADYPFSIIGGDSIIVSGNVAFGFDSDSPVLYSLTNYKSANNVFGFSGATGSTLLSDGSVPIDSAWTIFKGGDWDTLRTTLVKGEFHSEAVVNSDWGFLRLSSGGGTTLSTKSAIDIVGYTDTCPYGNRIMFYTSGALQGMFSLHGLALVPGQTVNFDTTYANLGKGGYGISDSSGTLVFHGATACKFNEPITILNNMRFVGVKGATYNASTGDVWICGDTLLYTADGTNAKYWLITGTLAGKH
jgi:Right handed beta helix region